jgi:hypothetical protein
MGAQRLALGRAQEVDGEMKPEVITPGPTAAPRGEGQRVVRRVAEQAAVGEAVLLEQILANVQLEGRESSRESATSRTSLQ